MVHQWLSASEYLHGRAESAAQQGAFSRQVDALLQQNALLLFPVDAVARAFTPAVEGLAALAGPLSRAALPFLRVLDRAAALQFERLQAQQVVQLQRLRVPAATQGFTQFTM